MKFSVKQDKLSRALQIVTRAVPTKASLPILNNILITANNNSLIISATNLDTAIQVEVDAIIETEGVIAVPAKIVKELISSLPQNLLNFESKGYTLNLKLDNTKTKFNGIDPKDYPSLPKISESSEYISISPVVLNQINQLIPFSASNDTSKGVFTGIYLNFSEKSLTAVATDGNRLSEISVTLNQKISQPSNVVIPAKTFAEVTKIFLTNQSDVNIYFKDTDNLLIFKSEDVIIETRVLDGQYPDYKKVIPTSHTVKATFSLSEFDNALKITNIFAKETDSGTIKLKFDPVEKQIKVSSQAESSGENETIVPADVEGDLIESAFNCKYLLDLTANLKVENIELSTNSATSPFLFKSNEKENYLHLIMPLLSFK